MSTLLKTLTTIVIVIALGVAWWLISPLFITNEVSESLNDIAPPQESNETPISPALDQESERSPINDTQPSPTSLLQTAIGTFTGLAGHEASGTAKLIKSGDTYTIRFEEDFSITNGPDLFVHLGNNGSYDPDARLDKLKGNVGSQNYNVPSSIDPTKYDEVWVWCRAFSVPFGKAILQ